MKRYGFNLPWMYYHEHGLPAKQADERTLDFIAEEGFDYARFPLHYHYWSSPGEYALPNDQIASIIDGYVNGCAMRHIHAALNLHQAPGYSVSFQRQALEKHNLWIDGAAQDAFVKYWEFFAHRYRHLGADTLTFNLVNEPPAAGDNQFTYERHEKLVRRTAAAIRAIHPERPLMIDGTHYGTAASSGLADLNATQAVRGYQPFSLTHCGAEWVPHVAKIECPGWPGLQLDGRVWDRHILRESFHQWRELEAMGVDIHATEIGCYNKTPNDVALRWFADLIGIFREYNWGWALWEFEGAFGVVGHGRPGAVYESVRGFRVDRQLLELIRPPTA